MLNVYAPAKVNLVLEVLGKHNDYHEISSILQAVSLCDILNFRLEEEMHFKCNEPSLERNNLVVQAAELLREVTQCSKGARIELYKHIPWGVGLGGGSSDAAATLLALNELWELGLSISDLAHLASKLGSDVPFFIYGGTALVAGVGEKVTPLPSLCPTCFVLLVPPLPKVTDKTRQLYSKLTAGHFTKGQFVYAAVSSLRQGEMIIPSLMFNVFEKVASGFFPKLDEYGKIFEEAGASGIYLAGSGPCLFTFVSEEEVAEELSSRLKGQGLECYVASSLLKTSVLKA
jgi:4-diphosphocytidyl-2-C-methyl-D-erythritol kinase